MTGHQACERPSSPFLFFLGGNLINPQLGNCSESLEGMYFLDPSGVWETVPNGLAIPFELEPCPIHITPYSPSFRFLWITLRTLPGA